MYEKNMKMGLVLTNINENQIEGYLASAKVIPYFDADSNLKVRLEESGPSFSYDLKTNKCTPHTDNFEEAMNIGKELRNIGVKDLRLVFQGKEESLERWLR